MVPMPMPDKIMFIFDILFGVYRNNLVLLLSCVCVSVDGGLLLVKITNDM